VTAITHATATLVDIPVETLRTDALQTFIKQETVIVEISTDDGGCGRGYSYTIGTGGRAVLSLLREHLLARLIGQDARNVEAIWRDLLISTRATAVGAITSLALASIDTALWDLRAKRADLPLWQLAGGFRDRVPLYDTEGGWLHLSIEELVKGALQSQQAGWSGIKLKVGKARASEDIERVLAVRDSVGTDFDIMVDANQSFTGAEATRRARALERADVYWFEEPIPADDVAAHAALAVATSIPIAVGESLYSLSQFREYLGAKAASIVQVDVARIGGITPWLKVAHTAEAFNVVVCPHFLMELHVSLVAAIANGGYVEHIPQLRAVTRTEMTIIDGHAVPPTVPGLGIDWDADALENLRVE
jgi:L-alanine-DL-glutamate epimerase-like enolase superfamily enzyme